MLVRLPLVPSQGEEVVVDKAAASEDALQQGTLRRIRVDAVLVTSRHRHPNHFLSSLIVS